MMRMEFGALHQNRLARENANIQCKLSWHKGSEKPVAAVGHVGVAILFSWSAGTGFFR